MTARHPAVLDAHRRLVYGYLDGSEHSAHELINVTGLTGPQVRATLADGLAVGWIRTSGKGCFRAIARPACCLGGFRRPDREERVASYVIAKRVRDFQRLIAREVHA